MLGSGYLTLLDFPAAPHFPSNAVLPLPSSPAVGNATPLTTAQTLLRLIWVHLPDKVFLIGPIVLGGLGLWRFLERELGVDRIPAVFGATLFVVNPFVADRFLAGQLYFLLAYALLPWALVGLLRITRQPSGRDAAIAAVWLLVLGAVDLHVAGMYAMLLVAAAVASRSRRGLLGAAVALGTGALLCAYWLLPSMFVSPGRGVGPNDLIVYATRPRGGSVLATLASMHGFWRNEFAGATDRHPLLDLLLLVILGAVVAGIARAVAGGTHRAFLMSVGAVAAVGLVLAAGTSFPSTAGAFRWVFDHVPGFHLYREPQKFLALTVLGFGVFGALGLQGLTGRRQALAGALVFGVVLAYSYTMLWGFLGQVGLSTYPDGWTRADRAMAAQGDEGRVLVLPWHLYDVWGFQGRHLVQNPAPFYYTREVLAGDNVGFGRIETQSADPFSFYVQDLLARRTEIHDMGRLVAPLDVRYIALIRTVHEPGFGFLMRQDDLRVLVEDPSILLLENEAWRGQDVPTLTPVVRRPSVEPAGDSFPPIARPLPLWRSVSEPASGETAGYVSTGDRCTDGWRLGDEHALCGLGGVATFAAPQSDQTLWRPLAGATLLGYLVSGLTLLAVVLYVRRQPAP